MLDGMFVLFICLLHLYLCMDFFPPPAPLPPRPPFMTTLFPPRTSTCFDLLLLFISPRPFLISLLLSFCLLPFVGLRLSAPCPVAAGCRLGPYSVSGKVAPQLAACPTRGPSLPGRATHTFAPPLPLLQHSALAGSRLPGRHGKVNSSGEKTPISFSLIYS